MPLTADEVWTPSSQSGALSIYILDKVVFLLKLGDVLLEVLQIFFRAGATGTSVLGIL